MRERFEKMGHRHGLPHHREGRGFGRFWGRFEMHGGRPMRRGKVLSSDELHLITLYLLSEKPRYGYEIIKAVEEHSSGIYSPSPGMIYPVLTYLEEIGHATPKMDGTKKLFSITEEGSNYLKSNREALDGILGQLKTYGQRMAYVHEQMAEEEMAGEQWGGHRRGGEGRAMKMEFHEIRHELKAAIFEKIGASPEEKQRVFAILRRAIAEIRGG